MPGPVVLPKRRNAAVAPWLAEPRGRPDSAPAVAPRVRCPRTVRLLPAMSTPAEHRPDRDRRPITARPPCRREGVPLPAGARDGPRRGQTTSNPRRAGGAPEWRREALDDLGGPGGVAASKLALLDTAVGSLVIRHSLDRHLFELAADGGLVNRKHRRSLPVGGHMSPGRVLSRASGDSGQYQANRQVDSSLP